MMARCSQIQLRQVYERLIDVMRQVQRVDAEADVESGRNGTELEPKD